MFRRVTRIGDPIHLPEGPCAIEVFDVMPASKTKNGHSSSSNVDTNKMGTDKANGSAAVMSSKKSLQKKGFGTKNYLRPGLSF